MKHLLSRLWLPATLLLLLAGCAGYNEPRTQTVSEAIDLSRLETFSVRIHHEPQDTAFGETVRDNAMAALLEGFRQRGFTYTDLESADFLVILSSRVQDETETFATDYTQPGDKVVVIRERGPSGDVITTTREREVLTTYESQPISVDSLTRLFVIDIVDTETDVMLWRGYMTADDIELADPGEVEVYIERILEELPDS